MEGLKAPTEKHLNDLEEAYGMVEAYASRYKYIAADHLTIADLSLAMTMGAAQVLHKLNHKKFPNTLNWLSLVEKEPFFIQIGLPGIAKFNTAMQYYTARNNQ